MRKAFFTGVCAMLLVAPALSAQAPAPQKYAYINSQQLFQVAPGRVEAQASFEKESAGFRTQIQKLSDSLQKLTLQYQKDEVSLSPTAKDARQKSLRATEADFQEKAQKLNDQQQQREGDLMAPILEMIKKVLEDVRVEGNYSMIFDVSAGGFLAAVDKNLDITDTVASRLKLMAPKAKPGTTAAPAGIKKPPTQ